MVNTIENYFQWKTNPKEPSIEKKYENHMIISQWKKNRCAIFVYRYLSNRNLCFLSR